MITSIRDIPIHKYSIDMFLSTFLLDMMPYKNITIDNVFYDSSNKKFITKQEKCDEDCLSNDLFDCIYYILYLYVKHNSDKIKKPFEEMKRFEIMYYFQKERNFLQITYDEHKTHMNLFFMILRKENLPRTSLVKILTKKPLLQKIPENKFTKGFGMRILGFYDMIIKDDYVEFIHLYIASQNKRVHIYFDKVIFVDVLENCIDYDEKTDTVQINYDKIDISKIDPEDKYKMSIIKNMSTNRKKIYLLAYMKNVLHIKKLKESLKDFYDNIYHSDEFHEYVKEYIRCFYRYNNVEVFFKNTDILVKINFVN